MPPTDSVPPSRPGGHHGHDDAAGLADVVMDQAFWDERYKSGSALER